VKSRRGRPSFSAPSMVLSSRSVMFITWLTRKPLKARYRQSRSANTYLLAWARPRNSQRVGPVEYTEARSSSRGMNSSARRASVLYTMRPLFFRLTKSEVLRYRSPPSGRITTIRPRGISPAMRSAAAMAAPELIPTKIPSCRASSRAVRKASSSSMWMIRSSLSRSKIPGWYDSFMFLRPWILWPRKGSTPTMSTPGSSSLKRRESPMRVPVVPMVATTASSRPWVASQISMAVPW